MVKSGGLSLQMHNAFKQIVEEYPDRFFCGYVNMDFPVHSKTYVWMNDENRGIIGFIGSANYSLKAFSWRQNEALEETDPINAYNYYNEILESAISCRDPEVTDIFPLQNVTTLQCIRNDSAGIGNIDHNFNDCITLSLVTDRKGPLRVPERSGLNWGQRPEAGREPNQAYIPIPADVQRSNFFPERGIPFIVYTDDGYILDCVRAQDNGKALHTYMNNSTLGLYFRRRLGVPEGEMVTLNNLDEYGRRDVRVCKIDDENYFLDFSV